MEIKSIAFNEFRQLVLLEILDKYKGEDVSEICRSLICEGFTKLTKDNIPVFLKDNFIWIKGNHIVDFGDSKFVWIVCGMDAMLINKDWQFGDNWLGFNYENLPVHSY